MNEEYIKRTIEKVLYRADAIEDHELVEDLQQCVEILDCSIWRRYPNMPFEGQIVTGKYGTTGSGSSAYRQCTTACIYENGQFRYKDQVFECFEWSPLPKSVQNSEHQEMYR